MRKQILILAFLCVCVVSSWTFGNSSFKDWLVARYDTGAMTVGMGAFENMPMLVLSSPDGDRCVYIGLREESGNSEVFVRHTVESQDMRQEVILSSIPLRESIENPYPLGSSQNPILFRWDMPVSEQAVKVGDWVVVSGYVHELIQSYISIDNGRRMIEYPQSSRRVPFHLYSLPRGDNRSESRVSGIEVGFSHGCLDDAVILVNNYVANELWASAKLQIIAKVMKIGESENLKLRISADFQDENPNAGVLLLEDRDVPQ